jgi:hypothetical protein
MRGCINRWLPIGIKPNRFLNLWYLLLRNHISYCVIRLCDREREKNLFTGSFLPLIKFCSMGHLTSCIDGLLTRRHWLCYASYTKEIPGVRV